MVYPPSRGSLTPRVALWCCWYRGRLWNSSLWLWAWTWSRSCEYYADGGAGCSEWEGEEWEEEGRRAWNVVVVVRCRMVNYFSIDIRYDLLLGRKVQLDFDHFVSVFWYGLGLVSAGPGIRSLDRILIGVGRWRLFGGILITWVLLWNGSAWVSFFSFAGCCWYDFFFCFGTCMSCGLW